MTCQILSQLSDEMHESDTDSFHNYDTEESIQQNP